MLITVVNRTTQVQIFTTYLLREAINFRTHHKTNLRYELRMLNLIQAEELLHYN
jgi:hypothetical protein